VGLFGEGELPEARAVSRPTEAGGPVRVKWPERNQVELRAVDLDALLAPDRPARTVWAFVQMSDFAKALYIQRAATVECANAHLRRRGLQRFSVCGMAKAHAVLPWHALAHNLMRMRSLNIAFAG
jgi:hypothetical protein